MRSKKISREWGKVWYLVWEKKYDVKEEAAKFSQHPERGKKILEEMKKLMNNIFVIKRETIK